jgi:hypothetical protein
MKSIGVSFFIPAQPNPLRPSGTSPFLPKFGKKGEAGWEQSHNGRVQPF